jgi:hypothetical protein
MDHGIDLYKSFVDYDNYCAAKDSFETLTDAVNKQPTLKSMFYIEQTYT